MSAKKKYLSKYEISDECVLEDVTDEVSQKYVKLLPLYKDEPFVKIYGMFVPPNYIRVEKRVHDFKIREDDVYVCSPPKCGTTWTQEMVWLIQNDLDFEGARSSCLEDRVPFLEFNGILPKLLAEDNLIPDKVAQADKIKSPRIIKTHNSYNALPLEVREKKPKLIYVHRNPRDSLLSWYNHTQLMDSYSGTLQLLIDGWVRNAGQIQAPMIEKCLSYWNMKESHPILFISFEEMKRDLEKVVRKVYAFLEKSVPEDRLPLLLDHLSFKSMKDNNMVNKSDVVDVFNKIYSTNKDRKAFMNKGESGVWKKVLTPEQVEQLRTWEEKELEGSDFKFDYD